MKSLNEYKKGELDGKLTWWNSNGQISREENYKDGKLIE